MKGFLKVMKRSTLVMFFSMGAFFFCTGMTKADASTYTKKALVVTGAKGSVTIKKTGGSKRLTITKSGVVTVKKGTKKGSYKIRVKVSTGGTGVYKKATKTVTVKVKVV